MNWRQVIDGSQVSKGDRESTLKFVREQTDYEFLAWCGRIYHAASGKVTGLIVSDKDGLIVGAKSRTDLLKEVAGSLCALQL